MKVANKVKKSGLTHAMKTAKQVDSLVKVGQKFYYKHMPEDVEKQIEIKKLTIDKVGESFSTFKETNRYMVKNCDLKVYDYLYNLKKLKLFNTIEEIKLDIEISNLYNALRERFNYPHNIFNTADELREAIKILKIR